MEADVVLADFGPRNRHRFSMLRVQAALKAKAGWAILAHHQLAGVPPKD